MTIPRAPKCLYVLVNTLAKSQSAQNARSNVFKNHHNHPYRLKVPYHTTLCVNTLISTKYSVMTLQ